MNAQMKEVREFVEQYFTDDEKASIHDCVRDALALRIFVSVDQVKGIRRELRARHPKPQLTLVPPVQNAHWPSDKPPPALPKSEIPIPMEEVVAAPTASAKKDAVASIQQRRDYYDTVLLENDSDLSKPPISVTKAMMLVKEKFGRSVDPGYAVSRLRMSRELREAAILSLNKENTMRHSPPPPPAPKEVPKTEDEEYAVLYREGSHNSFKAEVVPKKADLAPLLDMLSLRGVDPKTVKVYKAVKTKTKVTIEFE